jgi:DNA polymerase I
MNLVNISNSKRKISCFCRENDGKLNIIEDDNFYPFFFEKTNNESKYISYDGKPLKKIFVSHPGEVAKSRSNSSYSSDIKFTQNYIINKIDEITKAPIKYFFLDIEVMAKEMSDPSNAKYPVSCITLYNSFSKEYISWFLDEWDNETLMLDNFVSHIKKEIPDIILCWNSSYDYTYLYNRIEKFSERISPINQSRYGEDKNVLYPCGISIIDYLRWFKKIHMREASYTLDYIGEKHLGKGKKFGKVDFSVISEKLKKHNREDVEMMVELEQKYQIIPYFDEIRRLSKCQFEDLYHNSRVVESLIFQEALLQNVVLPNKPQVDENEEETTFEGATREAGFPGLYEGIGEFDLSSAYPAMIANFCLDPANIIDIKIENSIEVNGVCFKQNNKAMLPLVVKRMLVLKDRIKKEKEASPQDKYLKIKYDAIKGVVNCFVPNTDILTVEGLKKVESIKVGDYVYNVNPITLCTEIDKVIEIQQYDYRGNIYNFKNKMAELSVTEDHRFLVSTWNNSEPIFKTVKELCNSTNRRNFQIPKIKPTNQNSVNKQISLLYLLKELNGKVYIKAPKDKIYKYRNIKIKNIDKKANNSRLIKGKRIYKLRWGWARDIVEEQLIALHNEGWLVFGQVEEKESLSPIIYNRKNFMEFLGWFISEGSTYTTIPKQFKTTLRGTSYSINITQKNINDLNEIKTLICSLGFTVRKIQGITISFSSHLLSNYLSKECGIGARNKKIPLFVFNESYKNIEILFNSMYRGDGTRRDKRYNTASKQLGEDVIKLLVLLGYGSIRIIRDFGYDKYIKNDIYRIHFSNFNKSITKDYINITPYNGKVYCFTTEKNKNCFAGLNGNLTLTGQSIFGVTGLKYFRLFSNQVASSITFLVRDLLMYVKEQIELKGMKVVYWDTDALFINTKEDITDKLNEYIQKWALEKFGKKDISLVFERKGWYTSLFILGACHYYGYMFGKKDPEIKGIEAKRASSSKYEAYFQLKLLNSIIEKKSKKEIEDWICSEMDRIKTLPLEQVSFPAKIGTREYKNVPIFIRAVENTKKIKKDFNPTKGELFYYVFLNTGKNDVLAFTENDNNFINKKEIDWERIINRNIFSKVEKIFTPLDWVFKSKDQMELF